MGQTDRFTDRVTELQTDEQSANLQSSTVSAIGDLSYYLLAKKEQ